MLMGNNVTLSLLQGQLLWLVHDSEKQGTSHLDCFSQCFVPVSAAGGVFKDIRGVASTDDNRL